MSTAPLHLYRGPEEPPAEMSPTGPSLFWTLLRFYRRHLLHNWRLPQGRKKGTLDKDHHGLLWFVRYSLTTRCRDLIEAQERQSAAARRDQDWRPLKRGRYRLRLERLTQHLASDFLNWLATAPSRSGDPLGQNTRRAIAVHLQPMLEMLGPWSRRYPDAMQFWERVPYLKAPPAKRARVKDIWRLDEMGLLLDATYVTRRPEWWQSLIIFLYNTGLRIGSAMMARWENVDRNKPGWLFLPGETMKNGEDHEIPLVDREGRWLPGREAIEAVRVDGEPLLFGRDWPSCKSGMARTLGKIKAKSGIPLHRCDGRAFHAFRGLCETEGAKINWPATELLLAHHGKIGIDCYADPELMYEVVSKFPQPRWTR